MPHPKPIGRFAAVVACLALALGAFWSTPATAQDGQVDEALAGLEIAVLRSGSGATVVPVRVSVVSRRAVDATLELRARDQNISWELPVGLAANSEVSQLFVVPTGGQSTLSLDASLVVDGVLVAEDESQRAAGNANAVGIVGLSAPADDVQLTPEVGSASLIELDDLTLLPALDSVVISPAGLQSLTERELADLFVWTAAGHQLAIADLPGSIDADLPVEWRSSDAQVSAGTGLIRYLGTDWSSRVPPGVSTATSSQWVAGWFQPSPSELLSDAGFRVPGLGIMSLLLLVYLVLAGPVTFVVLSQMKRQTLAWVVVPGLAVIFAIGVFGVGRMLSSSRGNGYASIAEVSPAGTSVTDSVLIAKSGRQTVELPEGWSLVSTGLTTANGGEVGAPVVVSPTRSTTTLRFDIDTGSGGTAVLRGVSDQLSLAIAIDEVSIDGTALRGTVRNGTEETLENVTVLVGERLTSVGQLEAGQSGSFVLDLAVNPVRFAPELRNWDVDPRDAWEFGNRPGGPAIEDGPTNGTSWLEWRASRLGTAVPEGMITAVGWSRDLDGSLLGGTGRTAVVTHRSLPSPDGPLVPAQIRSFNLLVPGQDGFGNFEGFDGSGTGLVTQFVRPGGSDAGQVALEVRNLITEVEVWSVDDVWQSLRLDEAGGNTTVSIPDEAWVDDVLTVRYTVSDFFGEPGQLTTRLVPVTDRTEQSVLLPVGETSRRNTTFDEGPGAIEAILGLHQDVAFDDNGSFEAEGELFGTFDEWLVELRAGDEVEVRMNSLENPINGPQLDPYLVVRDPSGAQVAENDDFDGLNSGLTFTATTDGVYVVQTRPLSPEQGGTYVVRLDATFAGADEGDAQ